MSPPRYVAVVDSSNRNANDSCYQKCISQYVLDRNNAQLLEALPIRFLIVLVRERLILQSSQSVLHPL